MASVWHCRQHRRDGADDPEGSDPDSTAVIGAAAGPGTSLDLRRGGDSLGAMRFFFFGSLVDRDILETVIGRPPPGLPFATALLRDYRCAKVVGESFPVLLPAPGGAVSGALVEGLDDRDIDRILFFESDEYDAVPLTVECDGDSTLSAHVFLKTDKLVAVEDDWILDDWLAHHKDDYLRETRLWMALYGFVDYQEAERLWDEAVAAGRPLEELVAAVQGARTPRRLAR